MRLQFSLRWRKIVELFNAMLEDAATSHFIPKASRYLSTNSHLFAEVDLFTEKNNTPARNCFGTFCGVGIKSLRHPDWIPCSRTYWNIGSVISNEQYKTTYYELYNTEPSWDVNFTLYLKIRRYLRYCEAKVWILNFWFVEKNEKNLTVLSYGGDF